MRLWRYYFGGMARGYAAAGALLLAVFFLFDLISEAETVGKAGYSFVDAIFVVLLRLPARFVELSPIVAMLGITYALSIFGRNVELTAIRSTGVSSGRLAAMALLSLGMLFVVLVVAEGVGRPLSKTAMSFRMLQVAEQGQPVRGDLWIADPAGIVRITDWNPGMQPRSVELFVFEESGSLSRHIVSANVEVEPEGLWRFRNATVTDFGASRVRPERIEETSWRPEVYQNLSLFDLPVQGMTLPELDAEISRRQQTAEEDVAARLELWKRLLLPLGCVVFGAFAAALGLRETERGGLGRRLAVGIMAALVLYLGQQIALNAALVAGLSPLLAALLPLLLVGGLAGALLRRAT